MRLDRLAASVALDSLEMVTNVHVCTYLILTPNNIPTQQLLSLILILIVTEIEQTCEGVTCNPGAECIEVPNSAPRCSCLPGYTGNGTVCVDEGNFLSLCVCVCQLSCFLSSKFKYIYVYNVKMF